MMCFRFYFYTFDIYLILTFMLVITFQSKLSAHILNLSFITVNPETRSVTFKTSAGPDGTALNC